MTAPSVSSAPPRSSPALAAPTIQNVVATASMECRLDLKALAMHARSAEYNRNRFHALIMRIRDPRTTILAFASGRMVVTGAKSEAFARLAAKKHARAIQKCGLSPQFRDFKVQNFVGSVSLGFHIRLEGVETACWQWARYEPEVFPGLVFRRAGWPGVCLVFTNGKVVITGAKSEDEVYDTFVQLYPVLPDFKVEMLVK